MTKVEGGVEIYMGIKMSLVIILSKFNWISGYAEILDLLLSRGGPIEARNIAGTPLILAACKADDSCMKVLLDHNADVTVFSLFHIMTIYTVI